MLTKFYGYLTTLPRLTFSKTYIGDLIYCYQCTAIIKLQLPAGPSSLQVVEESVLNLVKHW